MYISVKKAAEKFLLISIYDAFHGGIFLDLRRDKSGIR